MKCGAPCTDPAGTKTVPGGVVFEPALFGFEALESPIEDPGEEEPSPR